MKLIKNIFLAALSIILLIVVFVASLIREAIVLFTNKKNDFYHFLKGLYFGLSYAFYSIALTIDKAAAVMFPNFWNMLFLKKNNVYAIYFGSEVALREKYSISKILGINFRNEHKTLNDFGLWFKEFLDLFEFDHVLKATE